MIVYEGQGNIFNTRMQTMVCPVNTVGVMGAGLALAFKKNNPGLFVSYHESCSRGELTTSRPVVFPIDDRQQVLCFATKEHWRDPSQISYVRQGLVFLRKHYQQLLITSLSLPMLGCGLGGLLPDDVLPLMRYYLNSLPIDVEILT